MVNRRRNEWDSAQYVVEGRNARSGSALAKGTSAKRQDPYRNDPHQKLERLLVFGVSLRGFRESSPIRQTQLQYYITTLILDQFMRYIDIGVGNYL